MPPDQLIVRSLVLVLGVVHLGTLLANIVQTYDTFNPSYLGHYFRQHLARPLVGLAVAGGLFALESPLSAWLSAL